VLLGGHCNLQHALCITSPSGALLSPSPPCLQKKEVVPDWAAADDMRWRLAAVNCWAVAKHDASKNKHQRITRAVALFKAECPDCNQKKPARYIQYWAEHLRLYGHLATRHGGGAEPAVPDADAEAAVELLYQGFEAEGQHLAFTSIGQALALCPALKAIQVRCGVTEGTLLRAIKRVRWSVRRRLLKLKNWLSPQHQAARLRDCNILVKDWPVERLRRVFWIDAATIIIKPHGMRVYLPPGCRALVFSDPRMPKHPSQIKKMKFYICVNAILGPVALVFVTGTSELEPAGNWLVSAAAAHCPTAACRRRHRRHMSAARTRHHSGYEAE